MTDNDILGMEDGPTDGDAISVNRSTPNAVEKALKALREANAQFFESKDMRDVQHAAHLLDKTEAALIAAVRRATLAEVREKVDAIYLNVSFKDDVYAALDAMEGK